MVLGSVSILAVSRRLLTVCLALGGGGALLVLNGFLGLATLPF